ncbi:hypothetical protein GBAR_LOCUS31334 [Geodia barretti]|uniref:Uncharacterized protein n=1 Tax=Geodia barretti TaxID=519541 RepID=A0AA35TZP6_GEOBA|nr:hypothetical protein GBAR_LOCUS31334 [Geodia barretti]
MQRISKAPMRQLSTERRKKMAANGGRKRESVARSPRTFEAQGTMAVTTDLQVPFSLFFLLLLTDICISASAVIEKAKSIEMDTVDIARVTNYPS